MKLRQLEDKIKRLKKAEEEVKKLRKELGLELELELELEPEPEPEPELRRELKPDPELKLKPEPEPEQERTLKAFGYEAHYKINKELIINVDGIRIRIPLTRKDPQYIENLVVWKLRDLFLNQIWADEFAPHNPENFEFYKNEVLRLFLNASDIDLYWGWTDY